jgi:histidinol-phosphate phosphatase family protein
LTEGSGSKRRAVFIDRDGVLNVELATYVRSPEQLQMFPDAPRDLLPLALRGIPLIIISNQAGVGKGLMSADDLRAIDGKLREFLSAGGVDLTDACYCTHTDEMACDCRKPLPGMILRASEKHGIDRASSFMIGDSWRDMACGKAAGVRTVFVPTGINPGEQLRRIAGDADYESTGLADAVRWICEKLDEEGG